MEKSIENETEKLGNVRGCLKEIKLKIAQKLGISSTKLWVYNIENINNFYEVSYNDNINRNRVVIICDQDGNPCTETFKMPLWKDVPQPVLLSDKDFLLVLNNTVNHYRIQQGKLNLVNSFYDPDGLVIDSNYYISHGIVGIDDLLYNFKTDQVINKHFDCYINEDWDDLGSRWGIPEEHLGQFQSIMTKKAHQNHMFGVTKLISVEQDDFTLSYEILMFVNKDGQLVSNLYYVDDMSLVVVEGVTLDNFDETIEQLKTKLMKKLIVLVSKKKEEQEKQNQMSLIIQKNLESIL